MRVLVVTHGTYSRGIVETSRMIIGEIESLSYMMLQSSDSVDDLTDSIKNFIELEEGSVLILADLLGGSPMVSSAKVMAQLENRDIGLVTGVNMPMLIEVVSQIQMGNIDLDDLITIAENVGKDGIKTLRKKKGDQQ